MQPVFGDLLKIVGSVNETIEKHSPAPPKRQPQENNDSKEMLLSSFINSVGNMLDSVQIMVSNTFSFLSSLAPSPEPTTTEATTATATTTTTQNTDNCTVQ